jgi:fermentation-respiration switch protein FrsA (DUF1100 family)
MPDGTAAAPRSLPWLLHGAILFTSPLVWWLLSPWVANGSERFYLLVPPILLALAGSRTPLRGRAPSRRLFIALLVAAVLAALCVGYNLSLTAPLFPTAEGCWRGLSLREVAITLYFLLGLYLLAATVRRLLQPPLVRLVGMLLAPQMGVLRIARGTAVECILLAGFAPFLVATFHVHRFKVPNPARPEPLSGRAIEDVAFTAADGVRLRAWFLPAEDRSERTLLVCHGMGTNRTEVLPYVAVGTSLKANVFLFDFRGHGDSEGHTLSFGQREKLDVLGAVTFLRQYRPRQARQIIALGVSMGTAALIGAAAELEVPFDVVVLDSGFAVAAEMTEHLLRGLPAFVRPCLTAPAVLLASLETACWLPALRPVDRIAALRAPVLIIHSHGDRLIPVAQARKLYEGARGVRQLWLTDTGDHCSAITNQAEYLECVTGFVRANCPCHSGS